MRILIIEDSSDYRKLLKRFIESSYPDTEIIECDPVHQDVSVDAINYQDYSLVFLDYDFGLPNIDGLYVLKTLNAVKDVIDVPPVIMLTGQDSTKVAVESLKLGATDYLLKHETNEEIILAKINDALEFANRQSDLSPQKDAKVESESNNEIDDQDNETVTDVMLNTNESLIPGLDDAIIDVPGYKIIREIGQGGMSTVLLARRLEDNKKIVLKVLFTKGQEDPLALKRFMQEYTLISCLNNPHIINIYERAFATDFAYIAMEYFPNGDLSHRIKRGGLDHEQAAEYLRQMAVGLQAVHDINVVHRDLKPGNILFRNDDSLTITDFGAAKNISGEFEDLTVNNMVVGTPYYMSPEQASGMKVDKRSDMYSLGVMFYQMLTGRRPFTANSISQLIFAHINEEPPPLPEHLSKYQPLVSGLMAKDQSERFQNANDIIIGLEWL